MNFVNNLEKKFRTNFFVCGLFFLCIALFNFPITAQKTAEVFKSDETINLSVPFRLCFQNQNNKIASVSIASDNKSSLFVAFQSGKIEKINLTDNSIIWMSGLGGEIVSDLILEDDRVFLITKIYKIASEKDNGGSEQVINYILWSLDAETGLTDWQLPFTSNTSVYIDGYRDKIFLIAKDGAVNSVKKIDAQKILSKSLTRDFSTPPVFFGDRIYIGTDDN